MLDIQSDTILQRIDTNIAKANLEQNTVLLNIETNKYYDFNQTGTDIWEWLETPKTFTELCNLLTQKYNCSDAQAQSDVAKLINNLYAYGLIRVVS